jgi:hypothetical protein
MASVFMDLNLGMLTESRKKMGNGEGGSLGNAPPAGDMKKMRHAIINGPSKLLQVTSDGAKAASKMSGVSFGIASMLKQSQIFTGVVGSIFQLIGAMIDIALLPLIPVVTPIIKTMGSLLKVQGNAMRNPEASIMKILKMIPIIGAVLGILDLVKGAISYMSGPNGIINSVRSKVSEFISTFGTRVKIAGLEFLKLFVVYYKELFSFLSSIWEVIGNITIPLPKMLGGPFQPFAGVASLIQTPLDALVGLLEGAEQNLDVELKKLNKQLEGVIGPDGIKVFGDDRFSKLDLKFGGAAVYQGYNATAHGTDEQFRMLMGGEELG